MPAKTSKTFELLNWQDATAPSLSEFEMLADAAYRRLPDRFRALCQGLVIRVTDFPTDDVLREMEIDDEFGLLGLFSGVGLPHDGAVPESGRLPNLIHLYRRPILDYWAGHEEALGAIVAHVLVHEIGHHFGLSDDDMERLEHEADAAQGSGAR
jgi:predicted Zn-dependent protease with MMP-like domain